MSKVNDIKTNISFLETPVWRDRFSLWLKGDLETYALAEKLVSAGYVLEARPNLYLANYDAPLSPPRPAPKPSQAKKTRGKKTVEDGSE